MAPRPSSAAVYAFAVLWLALAAAVVVECVGDDPIVGELPKYMQDFLRLPDDKRDLRALRQRLNDAILNGNDLYPDDQIVEGRKRTTLTNGFTYETDARARVVRVHGVYPEVSLTSAMESLSITQARAPTRLRTNRQKYGAKLLAWTDVRHPVPGYHAGHIIMHSHKQCDSGLNLIPQHPASNQGPQASVENEIRALQRQGAVRVQVDIVYASGSDVEIRMRARSPYMPVRTEFTIWVPHSRKQRSRVVPNPIMTEGAVVRCPRPNIPAGPCSKQPLRRKAGGRQQVEGPTTGAGRRKPRAHADPTASTSTPGSAAGGPQPSKVDRAHVLGVGVVAAWIAVGRRWPQVGTKTCPPDDGRDSPRATPFLRRRAAILVGVTTTLAARHVLDSYRQRTRPIRYETPPASSASALSPTAAVAATAAAWLSVVLFITSSAFV